MKLTPSTNTRLRKAVEIITDPDSTWHQQMIDLVDTAIELDPPASFVERTRPPHTDPDHEVHRSITAYHRGRRLTVVPPDGGAA